MCVCMYVCIYVSMYVCIYVSMYVCMCVRMSVCLYVCMYVYLCMFSVCVSMSLCVPFACKAHCACLVHRQPGSARCACDLLVAAREFTFFFAFACITKPAGCHKLCPILYPMIHTPTHLQYQLTTFTSMVAVALSASDEPPIRCRID